MTFPDSSSVLDKFQSAKFSAIERKVILMSSSQLEVPGPQPTIKRKGNRCPDKGNRFLRKENRVLARGTDGAFHCRKRRDCTGFLFGFHCRGFSGSPKKWPNIGPQLA